MNKLVESICALVAFVALSSFINGDPLVQIPMEKPTTNGHDHSQWDIPADMPDVYYSNVSGIITIVDYVNATYYVTIIDDWNTVVLTDTKVGGGTIDVSSLSSGDYTIDITTSWNHEFEGDFTVP